MNNTIRMLGPALIATTACSNGFDPGSLVQKTRVLAVQADTPFALPGQQVELHALAYDPQGRSLSWGWGECEDPASSAAVDCLRNTDFASLEVGRDLTTHSLTVPDVPGSYTGVVVIACPGTIERGRTQTIPIVCRDEQGHALPLDQFEVGMKRIFLRPSELNRNPAIDGLTLDGDDWPADAVPSARCKQDDCRTYATQHIVVRAGGASEQSVGDDGHPIAEQSIIQYYATGGVFEYDFKLAVAGDNTWRARPEDAGKRVQFWFVVRDDRGGVSWIERSLEVP